ncbi:hypothetical protein [Paenibacillus methanolicus]|uniref:Uncharacterized protein n=1 Tax=Paenibacillus methanolicus TaxID=582686 RepID=A0A5S5BY58_9BACL|nr:hypothetical protein [Paenibacillus methanolicus]TYP72091.1 hypothetical protein BCM02_109370 [Paenibacillus methanolicus]
MTNLQVLYELMEGDLEGLPDEYEEDDALVLDGNIRKEASAEAFKVFELKEEQLKSIEELFAGNLTYDEDEFVAVEKFKEILGIEEMSWIRYERTEGREEILYV